MGYAVEVIILSVKICFVMFCFALRVRFNHVEFFVCDRCQCDISVKDP